MSELKDLVSIALLIILVNEPPFVLKTKGVFFMEKWSLKDVILMALLAFLFGGVFMGAGFLYVALEVALTPGGYQPFANEILFGLWTMAAPMIGVLLKKKGSSTLGEMLAALAEMLMGSHFGVGVLVSGFVQGLGTEAGFFVTGYKRYDTFSLTLSAIGTVVFSFIYEYFKLGYGAYSLGFLAALIVVRFISVFVFGVVFVKIVMNLLEKVKATRGN